MSNLSEQQEKFFKALSELNNDISTTNVPIIFMYNSEEEIMRSNVKIDSNNKIQEIYRTNDKICLKSKLYYIISIEYKPTEVIINVNPLRSDI